MRYFYYGNEKRKDRVSWEHAVNSSDGMQREDDLVIEEDTIYEIDRECEACRQRIRNGEW